MPTSSKALVISAWLTGIYIVIELAVGLWTGSIAVLSEAFHTLSAVGGVLVAIIAQRIARRPADPQRSFGWYRTEIIGALINGGFLLGMAFFALLSLVFWPFKAAGRWGAGKVKSMGAPRRERAADVHGRRAGTEADAQDRRRHLH